MAVKQNVFAFFSDDSVQAITATNQYWNGKTSRVDIQGAYNLNLANTKDGTAAFDDPVAPGQIINVIYTGAPATNATITVSPDPEGDADADVLTIGGGESATFMYLGFEDKFVVIGATGQSA